MNSQSQSLNQFLAQNQNSILQLQNLQNQQLQLAQQLVNVSQQEQSINQSLSQAASRFNLQQTQQTQQTQQLCFQPNDNQVVCLSVQPLNTNNGQNPLSTQGAGGAALGNIAGNVVGGIVGGLLGNQQLGSQIGQSIGTVGGGLLPF